MVDNTIKEIEKVKDDPTKVMILKDARHRANTVLNHPELEAIERRLVKGERVDDIAKEYGLSRGALYRYKRKYLAGKIAQAMMYEKKQEIVTGESLVLDLVTLREKIHQAIKELDIAIAKAREEGRGLDVNKSYLRLATFRELSRIIQLQIDIAAEVRERQKLNILEQNKDWEDHKKILLKVFKKFPEAKEEYIRLAQSSGAIRNIR